MMSRRTRNAHTIYSLVSNLDNFIATILVGNNFVNIFLSVLVAVLFIYFFGNTFFTAIISTLTAAALVLFFGEIFPKTLSLRSPERVAIEVAPLMRAVVAILTPITKLFTFATNVVLDLLGVEKRRHSPLLTEEEVRLMIEAGKEEGLFGEEQRRMLHRIFEFGTTQVKDVMVTKDKIVGIDINASSEKLLTVIAEEGHSRIVVFKDTIDTVAGIIYVRDVLHIMRNAQLVKIPDLVCAAYIVGPDKKVNDLLKDFQRMKIQIAIIADKAGKTLGLVTLEDLVEEIVGEI
jgi:putative hemolysin